MDPSRNVSVPVGHTHEDVRPFSPYHLRQRQLYLLHQREFQQSVRLAHQRETQIAGGADTGGNGDPWMVPEAPIQHPFMRLGAYRAAALALIAAGEIDDQSAAVLPRLDLQFATPEDNVEFAAPEDDVVELVVLPDDDVIDDEMPEMDWDDWDRLAPAA